MMRHLRPSKIFPQSFLLPLAIVIAFSEPIPEATNPPFDTQYTPKQPLQMVTASVSDYLKLSWGRLGDLCKKPGRFDDLVSLRHRHQPDGTRTRLAELGFDVEEGEKPYLKKRASDLSRRRFRRRFQPWKTKDGGLSTIHEEFPDEQRPRASDDGEDSMWPSLEELEAVLAEDDELFSLVSDSPAVKGQQDDGSDREMMDEKLGFELVEVNDCVETDHDSDWSDLTPFEGASRKPEEEQEERAVKSQQGWSRALRPSMLSSRLMASVGA